MSFLDKLKKGMKTNVSDLSEKKEEKEEKGVRLEMEIKLGKEKKNKSENEIKTGEKNEIKKENKDSFSIKPVEESFEKPLIQKENETKLELEKPKPEPKKEKEIKEKIEEKKEEEKKWLKPEGQLVVDVYETDNELVICSAIAGLKPEDLDISIENDILLIKGKREKPLEKKEVNYFFQECYWGPFSRQIILPVETDPSLTTAKIKEGILIIRIPKINREIKRNIQVIK